MQLDENATYYDLLDLSSTASPHEILEAYVRTKATYSKDNVALYTLLSPEDSDNALKKVEEAYRVLSDPEKRRKYDENYGYINSSDAEMTAPEFVKDNKKDEKVAPVFSIDRVPPMENDPMIEDLLIPPTTDISSHQRSAHRLPDDEPEKVEILRRPPEPPASLSKSTPVEPPPSPKNSQKSLLSKILPPSLSESPRSRSSSWEPRAYQSAMGLEILEAIENETEWRGDFLKKVRIAHRVSLEEMAEITKVTKNYIIAVEEENFSKLPAPVYVRGFVIQLAKILKLPAEEVAAAYLQRYFRSLGKK